MIFIYTIITALLPPALPTGFTECNLCGPPATLQCVGALREPLIFHLPKNVTKTMLTKNKTLIILNTVKEVNVPSEEYKNHSAYFSNGTFKLNNARRTDAGNYLLQTFGSDGKLLQNINMHLEIQAAVSKPAVSQVCLSADLMNISCSSEGDAVEFTLTLDGHVLMQTEGRSLSQSSGTINHQTEDRSNVSSVTVSLYGQLTGHLLCHVGNNVSRNETVVHLTRCEGSISHFSLVAAAVISSVATLLLSSILFLCIKLFNKKARAVTAKEEEAEDEVVYTDVKVMKHRRKSRAESQQRAA